MGRKLNNTTLIDGVVYEAGTDEDDIDGAALATITADVWDDGEPSPVSSGGGANEAEYAETIAELNALFAQKIGEKDAEIAALKAELEQAKATSTPDAALPAPVDYSTLDIDALKAEIDSRNEGREDADRISKRGSAETLAAALEADDARTTDV